MKRFNYVAIGLVVLCFGGAVLATGNASDDLSPDANKLISYLNQSQQQDQLY